MRWIVPAVALSLAACSGSSGGSLPQATEANLTYPPAAYIDRQSIGTPQILLRDVVVIDGTGGPAQPGVDVWIRDGKIAAVGPGLAAPQAVIIEGAGATVLPGLIDAHTHLQSVPGAMLRGDSPAIVRRLQTLQLRAYLASGVTSLLDAAISSEAYRRLVAAELAANPGPAIFHLAPFLTPAGGYFASPEMRTETFADLWTPIKDTAEAAAALAAARAEDPLGVKVTVEPGMVFPIWPTFARAQLEGIRDAAAAVSTPVFVHSMSNEAHRAALALQPYAFVHAGLGEEDIAPDVLKGIKESGAYVVSTVAAYEMAAWMLDPAPLAATWITARVPVVEMETARSPALQGRALEVMVPMLKPAWVPDAVARAAAPYVRDAGSARDEARRSMKAVKAMYDAGIPIVMGADEGNWPAFPSHFHGVGALLEMELLEQAGLPRGEVIVAATSRAAKLLKQEGRIGLVKPGMQADLLVVPKNPLEEGMTALRDVRWVIKNGVAKTPGAWLHD